MLMADIEACPRPPDKSAQLKIILIISQQKTCHGDEPSQ